MSARRLLALAVALAALPATAQDRPPPPPPAEEPSAAPAEPKPESPPPEPGGRSPAGGMGGAGGGGPGGGMGGGPPGYDLLWYPSRSLSNLPGGFGLVRQGLNVGAPVWKDDGRMLLATVGVRNTLFQTDARLPDSGRRFPDQLWNLTFGANYLHKFDNGWTGMLLAGFGSASDRPFHSVREVTATLGGFVTLPAANGRDRWQLGAIYLYGGPVNFPLPILAYQWNPSDRLRVNVGLPLSVNWKPTDEWELTASYVPLFNINARLTYKFAPGWQAFGGYEFFNESYFLADRVDAQDRFFGFEQRVLGGVRREIGQRLTLDVQGGYGFGRYYGEGRNQGGALRDRVDVTPGPFAGLRLGLRF